MAQTPMPLKPLKDCRYTAFVSYAHDDDTAHLDWVSHFCRELSRVLPSRARLPRLPPLHRSGLNGPVAGVLSAELEANIAESFAMIVVVGEHYLASDWCGRELDDFAARFGEQGFRERLFIVAMSEPAMLTLQARPDWQRRMPRGSEQLWLGFFRDDDRSQPLDVYAGEGLVSPKFGVPFRRLLEVLAARLKADGAQRPVPPPPLTAPAPAPALPGAAAPPEPVPVPGAAVAPARSPRVLLGWAAPGSAAAVAEALRVLAAHGVPARALGPELLATDFADFATAETLVLLVDEQPLMAAAAVPGGHLQLQREAWLGKGQPASRLLLLDARSGLGAASDGAAWAAQQGLALQPLAALADRLAPRPDGPARPPPASGLSARIYIESNRHERTLWRPLGERIQAQWQRVCDERAPGRVPPLVLRPRGLPVDELDRYPTLDDADGVVLLWGRKTSEALVAQINKVEMKLPPGRDAPPGIVAYLMPPQAASEPLPAWGWQVLRFDAADEQQVQVVAEEDGELRHFLAEVYERHRRRAGDAAEGAR